jgi:hypothetical protein
MIKNVFSEDGDRYSLCPKTFPENYAVNEIMLKNVVEPDRAEMIV